MASSSIVAASEDLLTEILLRLPVKPLFRFNCVSKHWHSLITNPYLRNCKNINICKKIIGVYVRITQPFIYGQQDVVPLNETGQIPSKFSLTPTSVDDGDIDILQSCNGLLFCRCRIKTSIASYDYYICNPTTHQFRKLRNPIHAFDIRNRIPFVNVMRLAFDPRKSPHYKVLCLYKNGRVWNMEIYSSVTGQWRRTGDPFVSKLDFSCGGVYWNGAINWLTWDDWTRDDGLYFNVDEERFGKLPNPDERWSTRLFYGESHDHLLLLLLLLDINHHIKTRYSLYEMDRDYSGWFVRYHIDTDVLHSSIKSLHTDYLGGFIILTVVWTGNEEDSLVVLGVMGKAVRYNLGDKSSKEICDFSNGFPPDLWMCAKATCNSCIESISDV